MLGGNRLMRKSIRPFSSSAPIVLKRGQILNLSRAFSDADVDHYSKLSFDSNPLHFDSEIAKNAGFEDRLVPGMLVASLFLRIIASHFLGALYVSQTLHFKVSVYIREDIIGEVQATNIKEIKDKYLVKFSSKCFKGGNVLVIDGEATAILPSLNVEICVIKEVQEIIAGPENKCPSTIHFFCQHPRI